MFSAEALEPSLSVFGPKYNLYQLMGLGIPKGPKYIIIETF